MPLKMAMLMSLLKRAISSRFLDCWMSVELSDLLKSDCMSRNDLWIAYKSIFVASDEIHTEIEKMFLRSRFCFQAENVKMFSDVIITKYLFE